MKTNSLLNIELSPFWISELFPYFFQGYDRSAINPNIVNLIIPFVLTKSIRENILVKANSRSSFNSLFFNPSKKSQTLFVSNDNSLLNKLVLSDLPIKYHANKELSKKAMFIAFEKKYIDFANGSIKIIERKDYQKCSDDSFLRDYYKSAHYLGVIINNEGIKNLFVKCNILRL